MRICFSILLALSLSGCGTTIYAILGGGPMTPYCGVQTDWHDGEMCEPWHPVNIALTLDIPLSFVADTVLLPYTTFNALNGAHYRNSW